MEPILKELFPEKRMKPRILCNFPAVLQGQDALGRIFEETARVLNLSSGGIFIVTDRSIQKNSELFVNIALPTGSLVWGTSNLSTVGEVIWTEDQIDGATGLAIKFKEYKFL